MTPVLSFYIRTVKQSFSMLRKLLGNDHHFSPDNVWKYLALYVNKSLE